MALYPTTEKNLFRCIPKWKKTSFVVYHNGGKLFPLYPTTKKNLFRCIPQWREISSIVGYKGRKPAALWDTMRIFFLGYSILHKILLWCRIQRKKKISCVVGYNRKKFVCHPEIVLRCIPQRKKSSSVVSHNGGKLSPSYPTTAKKR